MEAILQRVEQACAEFQDPARRVQAEAVLIDFRNSSRPDQSCLFILERSNSEAAQFQAAVTLRLGLLRDWTTIPPQDISACRDFCLRMSVGVGECRPLVRAQLQATAACCLKRNWVDGGAEAREAFFASVQSAVAEAESAVQGTARAVGSSQECPRSHGLRQLAAVVGEFAPATSSAMGMPFEFHERCRIEFEMEYLQRIFMHAVQTARESAAAGLAQAGSDGGVCAAGLDLMALILSWDFQRGGGTTSNGGFGYVPENSKTNEENTIVHPSSSWRPLLLAPEACDWVHALMVALTGSSSTLLPGLRQVIVQLSSLARDFFPTDDQGLTRQSHFDRMLGAILVWARDPAALVNKAVTGECGAEEKVLDTCRSLLALASIHTPDDFERVVECGSSGSVSGSALAAALLGECLKVGGLRVDAEGTWAEDAIDLLLEGFTALLQPFQVSRSSWSAGQDPPQELPPSMLTTATQLTQLYVQAAMDAAVAEAYAEDDGNDQTDSAGAERRDSRLSMVAVVARACTPTSLSLLGSLLQAQALDLDRRSKEQGDPVPIWETLTVLVRIVAHVLADSGEGETPLIPEALVRAAQAGEGQGAPCPVQDLVGKLLQVGQLASSSATRQMLSPRVVEALLWSLSRWADSYLFPEDSGGNLHHSILQHSVPKSLLSAYSDKEGGQGCSVLALLVGCASTAVLCWPGEGDVHREASNTLLPVLVRRRQLCRHLATMPTWQHLAGAYARRDPPLGEMAAEHHRSIMQALGRVVQGIPDPSQVEAYLQGLLQPLMADIHALANHPDKARLTQRPDTGHQLDVILSALRGAVQSTHHRSQSVIFNTIAQGMPALLELQRAACHAPIPTLLLLKLTTELVETNLPFLTPQHAQALGEFCLAVVRQYSDHHKGRVGESNALRGETAKEQYKQLRALLKLLSLLSARELQDMLHTNGTQQLQQQQPAPTLDIPQVVFVGLHLVIPLISQDLLKFPKLCRQYFALLAILFEVYPERVATLPPEVFSPLLATLDFGLVQADFEVSGSAIEGLAALINFHVRQTKDGHPGLGVHLTPVSPDGGNLLSHFLELMLRRLLFEDCKRDFAEQAADALFPLILSDPAGYNRIGHSLLAGQVDEMAKGRIAEALTFLISANSLTQTCDRVNLRRFRRNLHAFLTNIRGLLRSK